MTVDAAPAIPVVLTVRQAAEQLGLSENTILRMLAAGRIPGAWKTSEHGVWRIPSRSLERIGECS